MKTIAITIDEDVLARVDRLAGPSAKSARNRSRLIREAVREHLSRLERLADDEREAVIVRRHAGRLALEAAVLIRVQAKP
jgi:metal-responsive CopG/Arc/MetJ family transcriptional regulator